MIVMWFDILIYILHTAGLMACLGEHGLSLYTQITRVCKQIDLGIYPTTLVCSCKLEYVDYNNFG